MISTHRVTNSAHVTPSDIEATPDSGKPHRRSVARFLAPLVVASTLALTASAATFQVNSTEFHNDGLCQQPPDGDCTLLEAMLEAELSPNPDVIRLQPNAIYTLEAPYASHVGLPTVTTHILIFGQGATIQRSGDGDTPEFRLFRVTSTGQLFLRNLTVRGGHANAYTQGGGAILNEGGRLTIGGCIFEDNRSELRGGAIDLIGGDTSIGSSTFRFNHAAIGGALYLDGGIDEVAMRLLNSSLVHNQTDPNNFYINSSDGGAIAIIRRMAVLIQNTTITDNHAEHNGGGISFTAPQGDISVVNSTIALNQAKKRGGGIYRCCGGNTNPRFANTILANNLSNDDGLNCYSSFGVFETNGGNILGTPAAAGYPCPFVTVGAAVPDQLTQYLPLLGVLDQSRPAGGEFHEPLANCTAIDGGDINLCPLYDQLNQARRGASCDIGAIESPFGDVMDIYGCIPGPC